MEIFAAPFFSQPGNSVIEGLENTIRMKGRGVASDSLHKHHNSI